MDTPERNQIGTASLSKFEDSPVFNYINNLSPIKPVKSIHITQTFNPLNFAALPSVFTSPHVTSHKESRFLTRNSDLNLSKPESSSENGNKGYTNEGAVTEMAEHEELSPVPSSNESLKSTMEENDILKYVSDSPDCNLAVPSSNESLKSTMEENDILKYVSDSPDCNLAQHCGNRADRKLELGDNSGLVVSFIKDNTKHDPSGTGTNFLGISQAEQRKEGMGYEWDNLIADGADLFIFSSPNSSEAIRLIQKPLNTVMGLSTSPVLQFMQNENNDMHNLQIVGSFDSGEPSEREDPSTQLEEACEMTEIDQTLNNNLAYTNFDKSNVGVKMPVSNLHRGIRRRCLDFETAGTRRQNLSEGSDNGLILLPPNEKQMVALKPNCDSSRITLPGIGLHLNALATTSGRRLTLPSSNVSTSSTSTGQDLILYSASADKDIDSSENGVQLEEEFNQNSPKKKKRKLDHSEEGESCKRCNCKKSKCLKLYCECFAAGVYCIEPCSCQECFNKPIHEETVLATRKQIESRNPLAFAPKVIRSSSYIPETGDEPSKTPASARHKRGCNCKKSNCLKKYCECYQGGVGCSVNCRCEGCKNAFGRKDDSGSAPIAIETEQEDEEEAGEREKSVLQEPEIQSNEEKSTIPATPLQLSRTFVPPTFSSSGKQSRSYFLTVGSSSELGPGQKLEKSTFLGPLPKFEKCMQTVTEDDMPDILLSEGSPGTGVKTGSPNGKRVSPPHSNFGMSPLSKTGRKLILQSIPSFPSLTSQH